jgi:excisionase family DNA binding protein
MADFREVMNAREASRYLGVSKETLYKYLWQQRLPGFKLGNRWRFKKAVLDRWMEKQSHQRRSRPRPKAQSLRGHE